jgi:phage shock protein C
VSGRPETPIERDAPSDQRNLANRQPAGRPPWEGEAMAEPRKLYRSRDDRKVAGVCGGLAQYFNIDPTLIRVLFVVTALLGGPGLLAYLLLWIVVPEEPLATP